MKIKQEASGWPPECDTNEKKRNYLKEYKEHEAGQTGLLAHRKEPRSTFPCQINAQFLLGKVRTTPPLNPTHHMHNTL